MLIQIKHSNVKYQRTCSTGCLRSLSLVSLADGIFLHYSFPLHLSSTFHHFMHLPNFSNVSFIRHLWSSRSTVGLATVLGWNLGKPGMRTWGAGERLHRRRHFSRWLWNTAIDKTTTSGTSANSCPVAQIHSGLCSTVQWWLSTAALLLNGVCWHRTGDGYALDLEFEAAQSLMSLIWVWMLYFSILYCSWFCQMLCFVSAVSVLFNSFFLARMSYPLSCIHIRAIEFYRE